MSENKSLFCAIGSESTSLSDDDIRRELKGLLDSLGTKEDVLLLPVRNLEMATIDI